MRLATLLLLLATMALLLLLAAMAFAQESPPSAIGKTMEFSPPPLTDQQRADFFKLAFAIGSAQLQARNASDAFEAEVRKAREKMLTDTNKLISEANAELAAFTRKIADGKPCQLQIPAGEPVWECTKATP